MSFGKSKLKKMKIAAVIGGTGFVMLRLLAKRMKKDSIYENEPEQKNPMEGKRVVFIEDENDAESGDGIRGHLEAVGRVDFHPGFYDKYVKRAVDIILAFGGLVLLAPVYLGFAVAIKMDDPGPVLFTQKRLGQNKKYFKLHKFRTMKMCTPHDVPTHMLDNPEQYITRVGKFMRRHSIDELPQIWDIFIGNMSVIGPRPGLWNQDVLTAERDKYGANDVKPGLTGWAQINGRDELEIGEKAKLDGEYVRKKSLIFDIKCFLATVFKIFHDDSMVEGGTGKKSKVRCCYVDGKSDEELIGNIGFGEPVTVDNAACRKVLLTGAGSYIGEAFKSYAGEHYENNFTIDAVDMTDGLWREKDFSSYDIVYHVAGIAHADTGKVEDAVKAKYYEVNTDLAVDVCRKAKTEGVKEFIFMSSMIVYGDSAPYGKCKVIDRYTVPAASNFYGDSKLQADVAVRGFADDNFKVIVLRPPMIYGKGSKGNYPVLARLARKLPVFPDADNQRSMLYIGNLCEFLCQIMLVETYEKNAVVLVPQNAEWTSTCKMVREIARVSSKKIRTMAMLTPFLSLGGKVPGKIGRLVSKAFGNCCYAHEMSVYPGIQYQNITLKESIACTEGGMGDGTGRKNGNIPTSATKKHILVVSQYFYPETFRINDMCQEWRKRGYKVTVITGIPNYPMGKIFEGYGLTKRRHEDWNGVEIIRIPLIPRGTSSVGMVANYLSFVVSGIVASLFCNMKADYVFSFEVSPMTQALVGISFARKLGVPHYLYVQDLWPENVITVTGITNPVLVRPINRMVDYIYRNTDEIFVASPSFAEAVCNRKVKVDRNKVHYWPQYAEEFYRPCGKKEVSEIPDDDSFKIIFTGNIGTAQGLQILPETAGYLKDENVKFIMVGDGRYLDGFNEAVDRHGVKNNFVMIPRQPAERIPELLAACDAAFLSFRETELWAMTIPAKLQSYMACGMPVIASAQGETKRIIEEAECGICSEIGNAEKLSEAIKEMMEAELGRMGGKSREYFEVHFDKGMLMDQMDGYFT